MLRRLRRRDQICDSVAIDHGATLTALHHDSGSHVIREEGGRADIVSGSCHVSLAT